MKKRCGSILMLTLLLLAALFFFGLSFLNHYLGDKTLASRQEEQVLAEEAAEAGIERALYELAHDAHWQPASLRVRLPHSQADFVLEFAPASVAFSSNNVSGSTSLTGWGARLVPPGMVHLC